MDLLVRLRISPYEDRLLSLSSLIDSSALINSRRKAELHRKQNFAKNLHENITKIFGNAWKIFRIVKNCQKTVKNVFNSYS